MVLISSSRSMEPDLLMNGSWDVEVDLVGYRGRSSGLAELCAESARDAVVGTEESDLKCDSVRPDGRDVFGGGERAAMWIKESILERRGGRSV